MGGLLGPSLRKGAQHGALIELAASSARRPAPRGPAAGVQPALPFAASAPTAVAYGQAMPAAFGASASGGEDLGAQITKLATLRDQGILSEAEFSEAKTKLISSM